MAVLVEQLLAVVLTMDVQQLLPSSRSWVTVRGGSLPGTRW